MSGGTFEPIKLSRTNRYAGYQFYSHIRAADMDGFSAFRYVVLTVCAWMLKRIPPEDREAPELRLPEPEKCAETPPETFVPYHFSVGYALDITPLMYEGIWSMRLKEPDTGLEGVREAVPGRFFTTRVGIRLDEKGFVELGVRIDVTDPASEENEIPFAFRPGFVRTLAVQPSVSFEQVCELKRKAVRVETEDDYRRLLYVLDSEDNQLPLAVFTYARPAAGMSMEEFVRKSREESFLKFSAIPAPGMPGAGTPFAFPASGRKPGKPEAPFLPYDADAFGASAFAYAMVYILGDGFTERFKSRIRKDFAPGDILLCGAAKFHGGVSVTAYPGKKEEDLKKACDRALLAAQSYSKHKAPYSFGKVVFEAEARKMEQHHRYREIVESTRYEEKDRVDQLTNQMSLLFEAIDNKDKDIEKLNDQISESYNRGREYGEKENLELMEENDRLKKELADFRNRVEMMGGKCEQYDLLHNAMERIRTTEEMPETREGVVQYYKVVYGDRICFTKNGEESAAACRFKPSSLWRLLYIASHQLVDVFALCDKPEGPTEKEVQAATGYQMSFREGAMTRENPDLMKLRTDEYDGKTVSIEPHLKLRASKGEQENQRLHFCWDSEKKRVVIGYIGEHLESVSSWRR